jgi:glycine betaine transporter
VTTHETQGNGSQPDASGRVDAAGAERRPGAIDWTVFGAAFGLIAVFCLVGGLWPGGVSTVSNAALDWIITNLGWLFILTATGFVVFSLVLAASRYGRIPLSKEGEPPEFSTVSWVAMMFSAGMGIGLMFYGVYEPVSHVATPPPGTGVEPGTPEAAREGLAYTFFHWGLHPWAVYAVVALALAYSTFRKGRGNLISSPFQSLVRRRNVEDVAWGKAINVWAIIATKFGGATSLGLGALQIAGGIYLFTGIGGGFRDREGATGVALVVIAVLVVFAVLSAVSGVARGIKWLSNTNMVLAAVLVLFVLVAGPTVFLLNLVPESIGTYASRLVSMSFHSPAFGGSDWFSSWTIFYWAWWISWTPFVSTFIARISRGRSIREFVLGVLLVPTAVSALWFVVLGGAGIDLQLGGTDIAGAPDEAVAFFTALENYPLYGVTGGLVMFLTAIFWVSGADASAVVLATLSSHGTTQPKRWLTALWAFMSAAVAAVLLLLGGLAALQTFTILAAAPFVLVMVGLCWALYVDLRRDPLRTRRIGPVRGYAPTPGSYASVASAVATVVSRERDGSRGDGSGGDGGRGDGDRGAQRDGQREGEHDARPAAGR